MCSNEEIYVIKNYGRLSYENGYKVGYVDGQIMGSILTITGFVTGMLVSTYYVFKARL